MSKIVEGYIIEAEKDGYYYHRTRSWIKYDSPTRAYVWTRREAKEILASAEKNPKEWRLKPSSLHPATFYAPVAGRVVINQPSFRAEQFGSSSIYSGQMFEDVDVLSQFELSSSLVAIDVSL